MPVVNIVATPSLIVATPSLILSTPSILVWYSSIVEPMPPLILLATPTTTPSNILLATPSNILLASPSDIILATPIWVSITATPICIVEETGLLC